MNKVKASAKVKEIDWLSDTIVRIYKADENAQSDTVLKEMIDELESLSVKINVATQQKKAVSNLEKADSARSKALKDVGTVLSGYSVLRIEDKKAAAEHLKAIHKEYVRQGFFKSSYRAKTSVIDDLLAAFAEEDAVASIEKLEGVATIISEVKDSQDGFITANDEYVKALTLKEKSATSFKKPIIRLINTKLVPYLNAISLSNHPHLKNIVDSVDKEISRLNTVLLSRKSSAKKEQAS